MDRIRHFFCFFFAVLATTVASPVSAGEAITYFHNDIAGSPDNSYKVMVLTADQSWVP